jgi:hypothetical protein
MVLFFVGLVSTFIVTVAAVGEAIFRRRKNKTDNVCLLLNDNNNCVVDSTVYGMHIYVLVGDMPKRQ